MKISALVSRYAEDRGWHIISINQPLHLFPDDGRKLKRVSIPSDPWQVCLADKPNHLEATLIRFATGATADDAVIAAIPSDLRAAMRRLEIELDNLCDCLQK